MQNRLSSSIVLFSLIYKRMGLLRHGADDVDTRAITRRLREDGSLIGVLSTEKSKSDDELLEMSRSWDIVGKDLVQKMQCVAFIKCWKR